MSETFIQKHWYDGWFYARFIDSDSSTIRDRMHQYIDDNRRIIDIGCGTGGFAMKLAPRSREVVGVDISDKQVRQARHRQERSGYTNIRFEHTDATRLDKFAPEAFDYATMVFVIHEIDQEKRIELLRQAGRISRKIVILDYHVPLARNFWGMNIRIIEYFTSKTHFSNFIDFRRRGGINPLAKEAGLDVEMQKTNRQRIFTTTVLRPPLRPR